MPSTGNIQNDLRKLQTELRYIKYHDVDLKSLQNGNSCELLKIYHYLFINYNFLFAKNLLDKYRCDFYGKTDQHFLDTMYKLLRDYFHYKPPITKEQFFSTNFIEKKLQMAFEIVTRVRQECNRHFSSTTRPAFVNKDKKQIPTKVFYQLHDMKLEVEDHPDEYNSPEETPTNELSILPENQIALRTTIHHLEQQIQILNGKIEDINERLNHVTSVVHESHENNKSINSTDLINFNARLTIVENELSLLRPNLFYNPNAQLNNAESKLKQSLIPQGILHESEDDNPSNNFNTLEHICSL